MRIGIASGLVSMSTLLSAQTIELTMKADGMTLVRADGTFDVTFVEDTAPGLFLPVTTVVQGQMSSAAFRQYILAKARMTDDELDSLVRSAIRNRLERPRSGNGPITVTMTDFRSLFSTVMPPPA